MLSWSLEISNNTESSIEQIQKNAERELAYVYFNSSTKNGICLEHSLERFFQKNLYGLIIRLVKDLVGWINELMVNISMFLFTVYYQGVLMLNCLKN